MTARPNPRRASLPALLVAGATLVSLAACSGDDSGEGGDSSSGDFSVADALADLPASALEDHYVLTAGDLDRATELADATRPGATSNDPDEILNWTMDLQGVIRPDGGDWPPLAMLLPEATNPAQLADIGGFRDELGWTVLDVSSFVEVSAPPARFTVLHGEFDVEQIDAAIDSNDDDVWSIGEEDFAVDVSQRSAARPLGESLRLAEHDGALAVSKSTPPIEDWLAGDDRLDGDDDLTAVAEALDEHDVYSVMILDGDDLISDPLSIAGRNATPEQIEQIEEQFGDLLLAPFDVLGAGVTVVDDEAVGVLAYEHGSADAAEENAELLETLFAEGSSIRTNQPLSDLFTDVQVEADGTTVTVTFGFTADTSAATLWKAIQVRELFASHR
jgi:hypothetical protein